MGEGIGSGYRHVISHLPKRAKRLTCPLRSMQDWLGQRSADLGVNWGWTTEGGWDGGSLPVAHRNAM